jgi:hypothetical protein
VPALQDSGMRRPEHGCDALRRGPDRREDTHRRRSAGLDPGRARFRSRLQLRAMTVRMNHSPCATAELGVSGRVLAR